MGSAARHQKLHREVSSWPPPIRLMLPTKWTSCRPPDITKKKKDKWKWFINYLDKPYPWTGSWIMSRSVMMRNRYSGTWSVCWGPPIFNIKTAVFGLTWDFDEAEKCLKHCRTICPENHQTNKLLTALFETVLELTVSKHLISLSAIQARWVLWMTNKSKMCQIVYWKTRVIMLFSKD